MAITTADVVLTFWFGEPTSDQEALLIKVRRWFQGGADFDREVVQGFGETVHAAIAGELDGWAATVRGRLALVLVLDQFTRNVFRGDARTYAGDPKAQALALEAFETGLDEQLDFLERMFLSMPLLHSEEPAHHDRLGVIHASLYASPPPGHEQVAAMSGEQASKYADIIRRFGRFPHRNALLGRPSTPDEEAFLVGWAERAPPRAMAAKG